jgi:hypothetical protein
MPGRKKKGGVGSVQMIYNGRVFPQVKTAAQRFQKMHNT